MTQRYHLDANVVLRFLRDDHPKHSPAAAKLFAGANSGRTQLYLSDVTAAEVFYVLARVYRLGNSGAAQKLIPLVQSDAVEIENRRRVMDTLQRSAAENVDFGDAYLAATAAERGDIVASFDQDMKVFKDIETIVPQ